jgi:predicted XRE-type DNA-binding protein
VSFGWNHWRPAKALFNCPVPAQAGIVCQSLSSGGPSARPWADQCHFGRLVVGGEDAMNTEVFESVWDALEDTPAEAENMRLRSSLNIAISEAVSAWEVTQTEAARRLGVTQRRLNDCSSFGNHIGRLAQSHVGASFTIHHYGWPWC